MRNRTSIRGSRSLDDDSLQQMLLTVIDALTLEAEFENYFARAAEAVRALVDADGSALILLTAEGDCEYQFFLGAPAMHLAAFAGYRFDADQGVTGQAMRERRSVFIPHYASDPHALRAFADAGLTASLTIPLIGTKGPIGTLAMSWFGKHPAAPDPQRLALSERIASQIAVACERSQLEQRLAQMAGCDALTGLASRAHILDALESRLSSAREAPARVAIALIDLDGFKAVNDERGHGFGDQVLKDIGDRIRDICRRADAVGRLGGDEFVVITEYRDRHNDVAPLLDRLNLALSIGMPIGRRTHRLSASIGVACFPDDGGDAETLLRRADLAMYHAKGAGGGRYYFFDAAMEDDIRERQRLLDQIPSALVLGQFELHYQPILRMDTRTTIGVEALIRWRHPDKGLCTAGDFIGAVERHDHGLVRRLGQWVLAAAVAQLRQWQHRRLGLVVHVNVSACYFLDHGFVRDLERVLSAYPQLDPAELVIELTETALLDDLDQAAAVMEACRAMGVRLALDDFGTGYASLTYLKRLPVDTVKIDQIFVKDMCNQPNDRAIVRGILAMAHALNLSVVAEGVETDAHVRELLELGCVQMQGYGLGRPQPVPALEAGLVAPCDVAVEPQMSTVLP